MTELADLTADALEDFLCEGSCTNPGICDGTEVTWCGRKAEAISKAVIQGREAIARIIRNGEIVINNAWEGATAFITTEESLKLADAILAITPAVAPEHKELDKHEQREADIKSMVADRDRARNVDFSDAETMRPVPATPALPGEDKRTFNIRGKQVELSTAVDADLAAVLNAPPPQVDSGREAVIAECVNAARDGFEAAMKDYVLIGPSGMAMQMINSIKALALRPERSGGRE